MLTSVIQLVAADIWWRRDELLLPHAAAGAVGMWTTDRGLFLELKAIELERKVVFVR